MRSPDSKNLKDIMRSPDNKRLPDNKKKRLPDDTSFKYKKNEKDKKRSPAKRKLTIIGCTL
jgi:hypothetical protein